MTSIFQVPSLMGLPEAIRAANADEGSAATMAEEAGGSGWLFDGWGADLWTLSFWVQFKGGLSVMNPDWVQRGQPSTKLFDWLPLDRGVVRFGGLSAQATPPCRWHIWCPKRWRSGSKWSGSRRRFRTAPDVSAEAAGGLVPWCLLSLFLSFVCIPGASRSHKSP